MSSSSCIIFFLVLLLQLHHARSARKPLVPAIFIFGDSLSDAGNNNHLVTLAKADYFPYGIDFPSGNTGRFTNGKTFADFIAEMLGLPFPPAYLASSKEEKKRYSMGVNYASGSAGILPKTGTRLGKCISLGQQLDFFQRTVETEIAPEFPTQQALSDHLAKSIFLLSIGSNDYLNNYFQPEYYGTTESPVEFGQILIKDYACHIQRLYKLGARKFIIMGLGRLGCTPSAITAFKTHGHCVANQNNMANEFELGLPAMIDELKSTLDGSVFLRVDASKTILDMYENPARYGFKYTHVPCCIPSEAGACIPGMLPCAERKQHLFWDSFHPSEALNSYNAKECFSKTTMCTPMNIEELAQA